VRRTSSGPCVPREAHALTLFRALQNGEGRRYSATTFPNDPYRGCERTIRMARAVGWIADESEDTYGVLDVLDTNGDIVADYAIPNSHAFAALKKKLGLVVEPAEDERAG
jgi:hypothetical protein